MSSASLRNRMSKLTRPVVLKPRIKQTASMIFLHGLGDTGHGWASILNTIRPDHLKVDQSIGLNPSKVQVICPTAPVIPITLNLGFRMPAWFDIESLENLEEETDIEGVRASAELVYKHIDMERRAGIPSNKIIVGGFSQGAALALYCALHYPEPLAGCIALSTFFPEAKLPKPGDLTNKDIPFFQAHGEMDTILPLKYGVNTSKLLKTFLDNHEFKTYKIQHECSDRELHDVKAFVERVIGH